MILPNPQTFSLKLANIMSTDIQQDEDPVQSSPVLIILLQNVKAN